MLSCVRSGRRACTGRRQQRRWQTGVWICSLSILGLLAARTVGQAVTAPQQPQQTLAYVGEQAITAADVDLQLGRTTTGAAPSAPLAPIVQGTTVHMLGLQRQALHTLRSLGQAASEEEIDKLLAAQPPTDEQRKLLGESAMRELLAFRISWQSYLAKHLNEKNLQRHFENQRQRFDGTTFDVEIATIAVAPGQSKARTRARGKLQILRQQFLESGEELTQLLADEPELELLRLRHLKGGGELHPDIIDAVLKLEVGKLSEPVASPTGVHLVRLREVTSGSRELAEVEGEVRVHMLYHLLVHVASKSAEKYPLRAAE